METLIWLIQEYGYVLIFFFTVLEGETIVALAGFVSYQGYLDLGLVIPVAILGAVVGDQAFFYFGRLKGKQFLLAHPKYAERVERIHLLLERYQGWIIFGSRFMYGFRTVIPIALGTSGVKGRKFLLFNLLGAIVWAIFFALGGYVFGSAIEGFLGHVKKAEKYIIFGVLLGVVIVQGVIFLRRRIAERVERQEQILEAKVDEKEHTVD